MHCNLVQLPKHLRYFTVLQTLLLRTNVMVCCTGLDTLSSSLTHLDLSQNNLKKFVLPTSLFGLSVSHLFLRELMTKQELFIDRNELTSIDGLSAASKLSKLRLSYNCLTHIPSLESILSSVKELYLNHNLLEGLCSEEAINGELKVEVFEASHNRLQELPASFIRNG